MAEGPQFFEPRFTQAKTFESLDQLPNRLAQIQQQNIVNQRAQVQSFEDIFNSITQAEANEQAMELRRKQEDRAMAKMQIENPELAAFLTLPPEQRSQMLQRATGQQPIQPTQPIQPQARLGGLKDAVNNRLSQKGITSKDPLQERVNQFVEKKRKKKEGAILTNRQANIDIGVPFFPDDDEPVNKDRLSIARARFPEFRKGKVDLRGLNNAKAFIAQMQENYNALPNKSKGPVMGMMSKVIAQASGGRFKPDVKSLDDVTAGMVGTLKNLVGESGRLTDQDIERMKFLVPKVNESPAAVAAKFGEVIGIIEGKKKNLFNDLPFLQGQDPLPEKTPQSKRRQELIDKIRARRGR